MTSSIDCRATAATPPGVLVGGHLFDMKQDLGWTLTCDSGKWSAPGGAASVSPVHGAAGAMP
jgi:hypothetical protein